MANSTQLLAHGWQLHQAGNLAGAEQAYRQALDAAPGDAAAWCYLGIVCHDQRRLDEAVAAYQRAIQLRPDFPEAFTNLGNTLHHQGRIDDALASHDQALRLKPGYTAAYQNKGSVLFTSGRFDEAQDCWNEGLHLAPDDVDLHANLGLLLLLRGDFERGWREYEWRLKCKDFAPPSYPQPLWDGSSLQGRTILLSAEQGMGAVIQFIRYGVVLKERYDCRVVATCMPRLIPLLKSCPGIDMLVARRAALPPFDVFVPMMSLPGLLHQTPETFPAPIPYLHADQSLVAQWRAELSRYGGVRIGIAWAGNRRYPFDRARSVELQELAPLGKLEGIRLLSLQRSSGAEQLENLAGRLDVVPLGERLEEKAGAFMDTAAVLKNLDLVIAVDTAVAHLAGAVGVPVWLALGYVPEWRWFLNRADTPWYPTMRLFRQPAPGDWASVFRCIAEELPKAFPGVRAKRWNEYQLASSGMNRLTRARHGPVLYNRHDACVGRSIERYGEFSEGEVEVFRQLVRPGHVVVEAGANIGAHTIVLSQLVGPTGSVYAFEPQRVVFQTLCANVALNSCSNVHCRCEALGEREQWLGLPPMDYGHAGNFGAVALESEPKGEQVRVVTVDDLHLPRCNLLKVDVEGMELSVLKGAAETIRAHRPILYVENDREANSPALIEHMLALGYDLYWHLPPLYRPDNYFGNPVNEFRGIVSVNVVGVCSAVKSDIAGLRRIRSPNDHWKTP